MPRRTREQPNKEQPLIEGALYWAAHGVPVFPCKADKRPLTKNGFKDAVTDPEAVKKLFGFYGDAAKMIGARMGKEAGMFAIDLDLYKGNGVEQWMQDLTDQGVLPDTRVHKTMNGGVHLLYRAKEFPNINPHDGVEVRGEGSYIILPPSPGYTVVHEGIVEAPPKLIKLLKAMRKAASLDTVAALKDKIRTGENFHDSITRLAARLSGSGMDATAVAKEVMDTLRASLAASPEHPRHSRWQELLSNKSNELGRIISTGDSKYNARTASDEMAAAATGSKTEEEEGGAYERMKVVSASVFKEAKKEETRASTVKRIEDFQGLWPFEGEGYFAHHDHNLLEQRFVMHPILCEDESILIAAEPKTGKTAVALTVGLHIATGIDLGASLQVAEPRGVLYFGLEGRRAIRLRIAAWRAKQRELGKDVPDFIPLFVVERGKNLLHETERQTLANAIAAASIWLEKEHGISLGAIFIDTYTKAMPGGDQNSVEDTSAVFDLVGRIRNLDITAAVAFIHHKARAGHIRGSTNIEADPDVLTSIVKDGNRIIWNLDRARSVEEGGSYHFLIHNHHLGNSSQGFPINAPFVEATDAIAPSNSDLRAAQEANRAMSLIVALGKGVHKLSDVHDVLHEAGVAPVNFKVRRGVSQKVRWDTKIAQDFYLNLVPVTGYSFGGFTVDRVMAGDRLDGLSIR